MAISADNLESSDVTGFVKKAKFTHFPVRVRPHINPLSDSQRLFQGKSGSERSQTQNNQTFEGIAKYKEACAATEHRWLDMGCAFGGLLFELSTRISDTLLVGLEIRPACTQYSIQKVEHVLNNCQDNGSHRKLHFINCNVMRDLGRVIAGQSIDKAFITYPDPHFKSRNVRRRLLSERMIPLIAYVLRRCDCRGEKGKLYIATDVEDLMIWMKAQMNLFPGLFALLDAGNISPLFDQKTEDEKQLVKHGLASIDPILPPLIFASEDAQRCSRRKIDRYWAIYERV